MKILINKINKFIDKKIDNNMAICLLVWATFLIGRVSILLSLIIYTIGFYIISRKFHTLEEKIKLLEFEKRNMLLALSDEDMDLKEYLEKK